MHQIRGNNRAQALGIDDQPAIVNANDAFDVNQSGAARDFNFRDRGDIGAVADGQGHAAARDDFGGGGGFLWRGAAIPLSVLGDGREHGFGARIVADVFEAKFDGIGADAGGQLVHKGFDREGRGGASRVAKMGAAKGRAGGVKSGHDVADGVQIGEFVARRHVAPHGEFVGAGGIRHSTELGPEQIARAIRLGKDFGSREGTRGVLQSGDTSGGVEGGG